MIRDKKALAGISGLILAVLIAGCSLFPGTKQQPTRPSPVRPMRPTRPAPLRPAPTKRIPGASAIGSQELLSRIGRIRAAVKTGDWPSANRETNALSTDLARYKPANKRLGSVTGMAKFDAEYARLQADVKARNSQKALADLMRLERLVKGKP